MTELSSRLLAYIDGEADADVEEAVQASAALQADLAELQVLDALFKSVLTQTEQIDTQDLIDVVNGQATANQRLVVAAWRRRNAAIDQEMRRLETESAQLQADSLGLLPAVRQWLATPMQLALGLRSRTVGGGPQTFEVTDLQVQVNLQLVQMAEEEWQLEGYITQNFQPVADLPVLLASPQVAPTTTRSDETGFFTFRPLPPGRYELQLAFTEGLVHLPEIDCQ